MKVFDQLPDSLQEYKDLDTILKENKKLNKNIKNNWGFRIKLKEIQKKMHFLLVQKRKKLKNKQMLAYKFILYKLYSFEGL